MAEEGPITQHETLAQELDRKKFYIAKSFVLGMIAWAFYFALQYYWLSPGQLESSVIRGSALLGATAIGLALMIGPIAKIFPKYNYIRYRRTVGVVGFLFIVVHYFSVVIYTFGSNPLALYPILNPYENPVVFGTLAFGIYFLLFATSTNWATNKLTFTHWKTLHRLIYFAWIFSVLHFVLINPPLLLNPLGYLLMAVTISVFALQITAFVKHARTHPEGHGKFIGYGIILFAIALFYYAYVAKPNPILYWGESLVFATTMLLVVYTTLKEKMQKSNQDSAKASSD